MWLPNEMVNLGLSTAFKKRVDWVKSGEKAVKSAKNVIFALKKGCGP